MGKNQLLPVQDIAADPQRNIRVQANAGTGKTFVLIQRLLRILFRGRPGDGVLCLTYTNAGASEMKNRILRALREWAVADDARLRELLADVAPTKIPTNDDLTRARAVFFHFLDNPETLQISTIHSFCEMVLRRFPIEAGISPTWRLIQGAEQRRVMHDAFARLVATNEERTLVAFDRVAGQVAESNLDDLTNVLIGQYRRFFHFNDREQFIEASRKYLATSDAARANFYSDSAVRNRRDLEAVIRDDLLKKPNAWLVGYLNILTEFNAGKIGFGDYKIDGRIKRDYLAAERALWTECREETVNQQIFDNSVAFFDLCDAYARSYKSVKQSLGALDFDDLLMRTRDLFGNPQYFGWVLSGLDNNLRHILVDEAQDTSPEQWDILTALSSDFQATGDAGENPRSLFVVGDTKQSIYSFQGASPDAMAAAINQMSQNIGVSGRGIESLNLDTSFRTLPEILKVVDYFFSDTSIINFTKFVNNLHMIFRTDGAGLVNVNPLMSVPDDSNTETMRTEYIKKIATDIENLVKIKDENPYDIMVLVQRRGPLAPMLDNELKLRGVPVAGSDRIILGEFLLIRDFLRLFRYIIETTDDYSLACVLKSPLFGLTDSGIYELCHGRSGTLGDALRDARPDIFSELEKFVAMGPDTPPYKFINAVLAANGNREKFIAAFGAPALEPLDKFITLALSFERTQPGGLAEFMKWFMEGESEIKLNPQSGGGVRIMTVHSAKGLEAKIVFLIDTVKNPRSATAQRIAPPLDIPGGGILWRGNADKSAAFDAAAAADLELRIAEYYRLLYVAMTRARDQLHIYGFCGARETGADLSWFTHLSRVLADIPGAEKSDDGAVRIK
ncbi:MAG: UvrD-helicase domain-containing protein [Rickettsiales bacterium]|jgi:ATP-dependent helicase/nuclease subunit A|nr:UvrD-helicase domain-containing protein [Rickettsiales bacterium]